MPTYQGDTVLAPAMIQGEEPDSGESSSRHSSVGQQREWRDDPRNPLNWAALRRWAIIGALSSAAMVASIFSTAFEPALPTVMADFGSDSDSLASLTISIYVVGYCIGPLIIAPVSELYGRLPVVHLAHVIFLVSLAVCGTSRNIVLFLFFRVMMGLGLVAFLLMGPAIAADSIPKERRGLAMSLLTIGPIAGPTLGPVIGGYISESLGWRWTFWVALMSMGSLAIVTAVILRESYSPVLQRRIEIQIKKQPGVSDAERSPQQKLKLAWIRPWKIIVQSPMVPALALYSGLSNSYGMIGYATVGTVFQAEYGLSAGASGLTYFGLTVGFVLSQAVLGNVSDRYVSWMEHKNGKKKPEYRLPPMLIGAILVPIGLLWYGWTLQYHIHWIVPIIGSSVIAAGIVFIYLPIQIYLIDAFTTFSASALGACTIIRSLCQALIPLAANPLYDELGYGWGNSVLALIAAAFVPIVLLLLRFGERIRTNPCFQPNV